MLLWYRSLRRRTRPIERYLDAAVRRPPSRGPAREDPERGGRLPRGAGAPLSPGRLPGARLRVRGGRGGRGRPAAGRIRRGDGAGGCWARARSCCWRWRSTRRSSCATCCARCSGSWARATGCPSPRSARRSRCAPSWCSSSPASPCSPRGWCCCSRCRPATPLSKMLASIVLALALALGLVLLIVRDMVAPVRALEERSDEMARGELARPVPPSGEADEIGRLSFAFEEMRRALRDKLRSTESLNIDLEREVRRRTEVLEQRNARAARRAREAAARPGRSGPLREAGLDGAPRRRHRARDQQPGERGHQHARPARGGHADRWPRLADRQAAAPASRGGRGDVAAS